MADFTFKVNVRDEGGRVSSISGYVVAASEAAAVSAIESMLDDVDPLTDGVIEKTVNLTSVHTMTGTGWKTSAATGSDVAIKAKFTFADANGFKKLITIPAFDKDSYGSPSRVIDTNQTDIGAFTTEIISGGFATNRHDDLTQITKAVEAYED